MVRTGEHRSEALLLRYANSASYLSHFTQDLSAFVRAGKLCIEVAPTSKTAWISEELCIGCGICVKVRCWQGQLSSVIAGGVQGA